MTSPLWSPSPSFHRLRTVSEVEPQVWREVHPEGIHPEGEIGGEVRNYAG